MRKGGKMRLELAARAFRTVHEPDLVSTFAGVTVRSTGLCMLFVSLILRLVVLVVFRAVVKISVVIKYCILRVIDQSICREYLQRDKTLETMRRGRCPGEHFFLRIN